MENEWGDEAHGRRGLPFPIFFSFFLDHNLDKSSAHHDDFLFRGLSFFLSCFPFFSPSRCYWIFPRPKTAGWGEWERENHAMVRGTITWIFSFFSFLLTGLHKWIFVMSKSLTQQEEIKEKWDCVKKIISTNMHNKYFVKNDI